MAHSQQTDNFQLPIFAPADKPTWTGDFNEAMTKTDVALGNSAMAAQEAVSTANAAKAVADEIQPQFDALSARVDTAETNVTTAMEEANEAHHDAAGAVGVANNAYDKALAADAKAQQALDEIGSGETEPLGPRVDALETTTAAQGVRLTNAEEDIVEIKANQGPGGVTEWVFGTFTMRPSISFRFNHRMSLLILFGTTTVTQGAVTVIGNTSEITGLNAPNEDRPIYAGANAYNGATGNTSLPVPLTIKAGGEIQISAVTGGFDSVALNTTVCTYNWGATF